MDSKQPAYFNLDTVALLRDVLDEAWAGLRPDQRATTSRTLLTEGDQKGPGVPSPSLYYDDMASQSSSYSSEMSLPV